MSSQDRYARIGATLRGEVMDRARQRAESIFGSEPSGTTEMSKKAYLELVRRNWPDPGFRTGLLARVGARQFRETFLEAMYGGNQAVWPMPDGKPPEPAPAPAGGGLPPMSDYQAQMLQDDRLRTLLAAGQGGTNGG